MKNIEQAKFYNKGFRRYYDIGFSNYKTYYNLIDGIYEGFMIYSNDFEYGYRFYYNSKLHSDYYYNQIINLYLL